MIDVTKIAHVYSGKDGRCCCGCAGKHTYASAHRTWAGLNRGYVIGDDEVSDRAVKMIVNKMNRWPGKIEHVEGNQEHYWVVVNERLYIAYVRGADKPINSGALFAALADEVR